MIIISHHCLQKWDKLCQLVTILVVSNDSGSQQWHCSHICDDIFLQGELPPRTNVSCYKQPVNRYESETLILVPTKYKYDQFCPNLSIVQNEIWKLVRHDGYGWVAYGLLTSPIIPMMSPIA